MQNSGKETMGQIVEIPFDFQGYKNNPPTFENKKDELLWAAEHPKYTLFDGILVTGHKGIEHYKIGQRKGLNMDGQSQPLYIIAFDRSEERIFVGAGSNHPGLYRKVINIKKNFFDWNLEIDPKSIRQGEEIKLKNHNNFEENAKLYVLDEGIFIEFYHPEDVFNINQQLLLYKNENYLGKTNHFYQL